jgi:AcrR family transcriptional regulator
MSFTPSAAVPRPLRRDAEQNRQRIMAAAREVFAQRGFDATLDEIADNAGLGVGTVYRRFPNKAALIDALFEESFARILELARAAAEQPDAWQGLVGLLSSLSELQAADRGLRDLMLSQRVSETRAAQLRDTMKPVLDPMVRRAQEQGALRCDFAAVDIPILQLMIAVACDFTRSSDPENWRRYLVLVLDALCQRRDGPTPLPRPALDEDTMEQAMRDWPAAKRG